MSNSNPDSQALQDIVKLLSQQLGELKHTNQNGSNNRTGGSTDYARSYRQRSNVSGPNFGSGASFSNQLVGDTKNGFNKMTLGLLPVLENNFLKPFQPSCKAVVKYFSSKPFPHPSGQGVCYGRR